MGHADAARIVPSVSDAALVPVPVQSDRTAGHRSGGDQLHVLHVLDLSGHAVEAA